MISKCLLKFVASFLSLEGNVFYKQINQCSCRYTSSPDRMEVQGYGRPLARPLQPPPHTVDLSLLHADQQTGVHTLTCWAHPATSTPSDWRTRPSSPAAAPARGRGAPQPSPAACGARRTRWAPPAPSLPRGGSRDAVKRQTNLEIFQCLKKVTYYTTRCGRD